MQKIILFYKFVPVADPETTMQWQKVLCQSLELKGRVIISSDGINGTLGGNLDSLKAYCKAMNQHSSFKKIVYKWSGGSAEDFPRLSVKVRPEIVTFLASEEIKVDEKGVVGGGERLKPAELNQLVAERGDDVVMLDGRNAYEAAIGRFSGAIVPNTETTRDFINELESEELQKLKDKPIVTYCTGGVRCEILTVLMKNRGFKEVYQLDGGIAKYGEKFQDKGLWRGKMYVFDRRMKLGFSDSSEDIGQCSICKQTTSDHINCQDLSCNKLIVCCRSCSKTEPACQAHRRKKVKV
jgi:UPF0176 protein